MLLNYFCRGPENLNDAAPVGKSSGLTFYTSKEISSSDSKQWIMVDLGKPVLIFAMGIKSETDPDYSGHYKVSLCIYLLTNLYSIIKPFFKVYGTNEFNEMDDFESTYELVQERTDKTGQSESTDTRKISASAFPSAKTYRYWIIIRQKLSGYLETSTVLLFQFQWN